MDNKKNIWKERCIWLAVLALIVVVAILTFWLGGKGNEIVSYVSFAAAGVSIFLAITAIFYSFLEHGYSRQHIGQMDALIRDASSIMRDASRTVSEKASLVAESAESMQEIVLSIIGKQEISTEQISQTKPLQGVTFKLHGSSIAYMSLLILYSIVKSDENKMPMSIGKMMSIFSQNTEDQSVITENALVLIGIMYGLGCFFDPSNLEIKSGEQRARNLPSGLKDYIREEINSRIQDSTYENREKLKDQVQKIDNYFSNL